MRSGLGQPQHFRGFQRGKHSPASLKSRAGLRVLPAQELGGLQPDVAVFDLAAGQPDIALALWKAQPHLLLIGVDVGTDRALILSGQPSRVLTVEDLVKVIEGQASAEEENCHENRIL